ncbi:hypothetical protein AKO1_010490 [Acrasis kona]|uniref:Uncharacterized protein n=1 Tax=Acrasis kona TaxID=1008807 RepID=A0AAW2ZL22_9EUKA
MSSMIDAASLIDEYGDNDMDHDDFVLAGGPDKVENLNALKESLVDADFYNDFGDDFNDSDIQ